MNSFKIKPPTFLLIAMTLVIVLHFSLPIMTLIPAPWTLLGIIPVITGLAIDLDADRIFHQAKTPVCPFESSSVLVTHGPYRLTRNPMYLGFVLVLAGTAILLGSLTPFVIALVFAVLVDRMFIRMEEQKLSASFGPEWERYKSRTRRWL